VGRFLSEDPLGLRAGPNPYEYGFDNPLRYVDPTGNQPWQQAALAGGGTLGGLAGSGALGGAAAAALPPVAVAAAGAAAIYGAWHLGEWIAEQPWNPLTHPRDLPQPRAIPKCWNRPRIPFIPIIPPLGPNNPPRDTDKEDECFKKCGHLLGWPGDYGNRFRKCYRECKGTL
jgi:hypothetical protein